MDHEAKGVTVSEHAARFEMVAAHLERTGVARNRRGSLLGLDGTVRAMTSSGAVVVKLDAARVVELVERGVGVHYKGQVNRWLALSPTCPLKTVDELVAESLER